MDVIAPLAAYLQPWLRFIHDRVRSTTHLYSPSLSLDSIPLRAISNLTQ
jgi:hypothetical protein